MLLFKYRTEINLYCVRWLIMTQLLCKHGLDEC